MKCEKSATSLMLDALNDAGDAAADSRCNDCCLLVPDDVDASDGVHEGDGQVAAEDVMLVWASRRAICQGLLNIRPLWISWTTGTPAASSKEGSSCASSSISACKVAP